MFGNNIPRIGAAALMIAVANPSLPAAAQDLPLDQRVFRVPCCRCIDGSEQTVDVSTGAAPWRVMPPAGAPAMAVPVPVDQVPGSWTSLPPATWVRHPTVQGQGNYDYELLVFVANCIIPARVSVTGHFAADNGGSLKVNANPAIRTDSIWGYATRVPVPPFSLAAGMNTIRVRVNNPSGRTGFLLKAVVRFTCPLIPQVIQLQVAPGGA